MRLRLLILVLMLACAGLKAQTALNVQYFFSNYTTQPAAVKLITLTPLQPFGNYGGTNLVPIPMSRVTDASGQYTFTNIVAGYTYSISLFDGSKYYIQTNGFPAGLTGTVNGAAYAGIYLAPNFYYAVFTNQTFSTNLVINYSTNVFNVTNNLSGTNIFIAAGTNILVQTNGGVYTVNAPFQSILTNGITAAAYLATNTIVFTNLLPALTNGLVSANVTNGLATINYVNAITNGLVASTITNGLATTNFVLASIIATNGANLAATTNLVALATNGLVTTGVTNGLATTNFVQATAQPISTTLTALAGTAAFTNQLAAGTNVIFSTNVLGQVAVSATNQTFLTNGFTGIVTVNPGTVVYTNQLPFITNGFISSSSVSGLASTNYVNAATNGLVTASVTNGLQTSTGVTNIVFGPGSLTQWQSVPTNNFQTQTQSATNFVVLSNQTVAVQSFANGVSNNAASTQASLAIVSNSVTGNSGSIATVSNFTASATTTLSNNVSTNLVLINNASNATVSLQGYITTNQNPLFVAATNGTARSPTIADLLIFGTKTNIVVGTNQIGIIGGGSPGVNGTYFQTNPFVTIWINTSFFAPQWILQLTGGNFYLQSNGITEYQSATGQGQWTLVNGIAPAPYSAFGSEYRMDGVRLAGNIYATNLTAQSQYWATNLNLPSNSIYNMILAYSVGPTNGLSTNGLYSILASSNYASVNFTTNLVAITSNALSSVSGVTPSTVTNIALYAATNAAINLQMGGVLVGPPTNTFFNAAGSNIIGAIVTNEIGSGYVKTQSGLSTNQTLYSSTINAGNDVAMTGLTFQHLSTTNAVGFYTSANDSPGSFYIDDRGVAPLGEAYSSMAGGLGNDIGNGGENGNSIFGGFGNKINGPLPFPTFSFIAGGQTNQIVSSSYSFASGLFSTITNDRVFMYNDGSGGQRYSGTSDQAVFYLANGFAINTNNAGTNALEVNGSVDSAIGFTIRGLPVTSVAGINGGGPSFTPTSNLVVIVATGASTNFNGLYTNATGSSYINQNGLGGYITNGFGFSGFYELTITNAGANPTNFTTLAGPVGMYYSSSPNFGGGATVSYSSLAVTNFVNYFGSFTGNGSGLTNVNATTATNGADGSRVLTTNQISPFSFNGSGNEIDWQSEPSIIPDQPGTFSTFIGGRGTLGLGEDNVMVGDETGAALAIGQENTAVGQGAFYNSDGSENSAFGTDSLRLQEGGYNNTAFGAYSLSALVNGSNNIAIGYQAGIGLDGNETNDIDIGTSGATGENNVIRIGSTQLTNIIAGKIFGNAAGLTNGVFLTNGLISAIGATNLVTSNPLNAITNNSLQNPVIGDPVNGTAFNTLTVVSTNNSGGPNQGLLLGVTNISNGDTNSRAFVSTSTPYTYLGLLTSGTNPAIHIGINPGGFYNSPFTFRHDANLIFTFYLQPRNNVTNLAVSNIGDYIRAGVNNFEISSETNSGRNIYINSDGGFIYTTNTVYQFGSSSSPFANALSGVYSSQMFSRFTIAVNGLMAYGDGTASRSLFWGLDPTATNQFAIGGATNFTGVANLRVTGTNYANSAYITNSIAAGSLIGNGSGITNLSATNIVHTAITTNFISGQFYTNNYGTTIAVSGSVALTTASIAGFSQMQLQAFGNSTNYSTVISAVAGLTGAMTNAMATTYVSPGNYFTWTNTSSGAGDTSQPTTGQIFY